jgi:uncharacterized membrane protein
VARSGHPRSRRDTQTLTGLVTIFRRVVIVIAFVLGLFFIVRAIVELVTIDYSDPTSYAADWGGPSLAGVLIVHCGLGLLSVVAIGVYFWRRSHPPE